MKTVLMTDVNLEPYAEDREPEHPFADLDFNQIEARIKELREEFPEYDVLEYQYKFKSHGRGAMSAWYDLVGWNV